MEQLVHVFEARSCPGAWLQAAEYLAEKHTAYNIVLGVQEPAHLQPLDVAVIAKVDSFLEARGADPTNSVASLIFPMGLYSHGGATEVFEEYPNIWKKSKGRWDGYAGRMLAKSLVVDGTAVSPLARLVTKMRRHARRGGLRAVYEMSIDDPADPLLDLAIYDAQKDGGSPYPPCLMHLSFKMVEQRIRLTALYRSHYYIQMALGNLIGLAQLQLFVATEIGHGFQPGPLVCHSTYATFDTSRGKWGIRDAMQLIRDCVEIRNRYDSSTAAATA